MVSLALIAACVVLSVVLGVFVLYKFYVLFQFGYVGQGSAFMLAGLLFIFIVPYFLISLAIYEPRLEGMNVAVRSAGHGYIFSENAENGMKVRLSSIYSSAKNFGVDFVCISDECADMPEYRNFSLRAMETIEFPVELEVSEIDYVMIINVSVNSLPYDQLELKVT